MKTLAIKFRTNLFRASTRRWAEEFRRATLISGYFVSFLSRAQGVILRPTREIPSSRTAVRSDKVVI
jgi:hypothetical protein